MPFEEIVQKILSSRPDLTREEVFKMIEKKEGEAKGFLTHESAARIVAAELGVESSKFLFKRDVSIGDLIQGLGNVTVAGRIIFVHPLQRFVRADETEGKVRRLFVADKTGAMKIVLWDEKADAPNMENLTGQIVRFSRGYVRRGFDGRLELNIGSKGKLETSPPSASEDEFPPLTSFIKKISELTATEGTVNVFGVVEQVYPASSFKRDDGSEGKVSHLELRDNSGRIIAVLWNNKVDELTEVGSGKFLEIFGAKVKKSSNGNLELHVDSSTNITILAKKPSELDHSLPSS